jgi:Big-like domain-containing protein
MKRDQIIHRIALLFLLLLVILTSCGGGSGGGGESLIPGPPFIAAELDSFPTGSVPSSFLPSGFNSNADVIVQDDNSGAPITDATVIINGVTLTYNATNQDYEGNLEVDPGASVNLSVTAGGNTYTATGTQFTSYPTITAPVSDAPCPASIANNVIWSGGTPTTNSQYDLGVLDASNGQLIWPSNNVVQPVPIGTTSYSIPGNSLTTGNSLVIVDIDTTVSISGAAFGSLFYISGLNYVPITVTNAALTSIAVTPINPVIGQGASQQFTAVGTFSDGSTVDLTDEVAWTSSDITTATINSGGLAYGAGVRSVIITATLGSKSDFTTLTVTPPVVVSIAMSPTNPIIPIGTPQQMTATGTFTDTTIQNVTTSVIWSSSNTGVASISNTAGSNGLLTSKASGTTTITATSGNVIGSTTLAVTGSTWSPRVSGTTYDLHGITWSGTTLVAVGGIGYNKSGQYVIITSPDGITWTLRSPSALSQLNDVAWSGSQFVSIGPTDILTSPDGVSWTNQPHGYIYQNAIAWSGSKFVTVGSGGYDLSSTDGITWLVDISLNNYVLNDLTWSGAQFVAVGQSGAIVTSPNGVSWTLQNLGSTFTLNGIACSGSLCSAVGASGIILTSPDGITWTGQDSGSTNDLNAIIWSGNEFIAVGTHGTILTSPDGQTWSSQGWGPGTYGPNFRDVTWTGSEYVVVGYGGIIFTSQ